MATNIGTAFFNVTFNTAAARREVTALVSGINRSFGLIGGVALVGATAAIAGLIRSTYEIGVAALSASIDYEQAFAGVRKTVDDGTLSAQEASSTFGQLNKDLRELALVVPLDLNTEIAKIAELGGQLGIPAENLLEFTRTVGEMGVTTNVTVEDAATSFARLGNIMGLTEEDYRGLGDTVVNLGNKLPAQEDEILRFANRIASAGEISGFTADEVLAVGAAMASVGVPSERGGTAVQRTWIKITQAVAEGGENLELIAAVSGETSEAFQQHWEEDAAGAWTLFIEGLGKAGTQGFQILKDLGLNDQRVIQSLLSLASAGDLMRTTFGFAADDLGAMATEADIFFNTTAGQIHLFQNRMNDVGITIGDRLKPAFVDILQMVNEWIATNPELIGQLADGLAGVLRDVGGLIEKALPHFANLVRILPVIADKAVEAAGPLLDLAGAVIDVGAAVADVVAWADKGAESGDNFGAAFVNQATKSTPLLAKEGLQIGSNLFDSIAAAMAIQDWDELSGGEKLLRGFFPPTAVVAAVLSEFGDATTGALADVQNDLAIELLKGRDPLEAYGDAFVRLDRDLKDISPELGITTEMFKSMTSNLPNDQMGDLLVLLDQLGIRLPLAATLFADEGGPSPGHPHGGKPAGARLGPQDLDDMQEYWDLLEDQNQAIRDQTKLDAFTAITDAAETFGLSIDVILDNYERLAPAASEAMASTEEGLGEATIRADLFGQSMDNLRNIMDFRPASEGMFGVGDIVTGIEEVTRTIEGAKGEADREVKITAAQYAAQVKENLRKIAIFEANLVILYARGQEALARDLQARGPEFGNIAAGLVADQGLAAETEATMVWGGPIPDAQQAALDEALRNAPVPQGVLDFAAELGNHEVQSTVYSAAYASGQQFGPGFEAGLASSLSPQLRALLGIAAPPGSGRAGPSGILDRGPLPSPAPPPGGGSSAVGITQNFYAHDVPTPQTQQAAQQAAAILG